MKEQHQQPTQDAMSIQNVFDLLEHRTYDDAVAGISIARLVDDDVLSHYAARLMPNEKITPHCHQNGHEVYPILEGEGPIHTWLPQSSTRNTQRVKRGAIFSVPPGSVHRLENDSNDALVLVFACSPSHLAEDRVV
jgi:mannose-6-phosphate isomerase-like protein (cupin superfamily)